MTSKEVITHLLSLGYTKYRIAKTVGIQPILVDRYLDGKRMSFNTALRVWFMFDIMVIDVHTKGAVKL